MKVIYKKNVNLDLDQFIDLYRSSTLAERRPAENREVMNQMKDNSDLTITAWDGDKLIGISRALSDFAYVAYLADLAVDITYQKKGIGKQLIQETKDALSPGCMLVLLAAPTANDYYHHLGFEHNPRGWVLK